MNGVSSQSGIASQTVYFELELYGQYQSEIKAIDTTGKILCTSVLRRPKRNCNKFYHEQCYVFLRSGYRKAFLH